MEYILAKIMITLCLSTIPDCLLPQIIFLPSSWHLMLIQALWKCFSCNVRWTPIETNFCKQHPFRGVLTSCGPQMRIFIIFTSGHCLNLWLHYDNKKNTLEQLSPHSQVERSMYMSAKLAYRYVYGQARCFP